MSIGTVAVYGLFNLTPKLRSPLSKRRIKTPMCIKPTRAIEYNNMIVNMIQRFLQKDQLGRKLGSYIGLLWNHSDDTVLGPELQVHLNSSVHSIEISCYNHRASRKIQVTLDGNVLFLLSLANKFALKGCSIIQ